MVTALDEKGSNACRGRSLTNGTERANSRAWLSPDEMALGHAQGEWGSVLFELRTIKPVPMGFYNHKTANGNYHCQPP